MASKAHKRLISGAIALALLGADLHEQHFVTMVLVLVDGTSGALSWANFGHPMGFVLDRSGAVKADLNSGCMPLGLFLGLSYMPGATITLECGDTLVLLTDGILEAASTRGDEFGSAVALNVVRSVIDRPPREIADRVIAATQSFLDGQPQDDDLTVIVGKCTTPSPSTS